MAAALGEKTPPLADRLSSIERREENMARWAERVNQRLRTLEAAILTLEAELAKEGQP